MPAGKTYIKIATQTLASTSTSVTFSNLPQGYTDLVLVFNTRNSRATPNDGLGIRFNDDSGTNYFETRLTSESGGPYYDQFNRSYINSYGTTAANAASNLFGLDVISVMNYSSSNMCKTVLCRGNASGYGSSIGSGVWNSTSPITSINITPGFAGSPYNFSSGSTFTIYGIECAKNPYATGGDKVYTTGTHWVHEFYNSGLFVPRQNLTADYLIIAGGGAGGGNQGDVGGGGGAGGMRSTVTATGGGGSLESALSLTGFTTYAVTVGAGGAIAVGKGGNGSNSVFATITSVGGGGGVQAGNASAAGSGGSGGGSGYSDGGPGTGTASQGYNGAAGNGTNYGTAGGGGGAGSAGSAGTSTTGGNGGNGVATTITGSSVTYAGGGGGAVGYIGTTYGTGGTGGGGAGGSNSSVASSGTANTGGGGGGAAQNSGYTKSGAGGSGIVIVRYPV